MEDDRKNDLINYWVDGSKESLRLAEIVFENKFFSHALFCCHLALEKLLKAKIIEKIDSHPPFSHDLLYLAGLAEINLDENNQKILSEMNIYNIEGRYPDEKLELSNTITENSAQILLYKTKEFHQWLSK